MGQVWRGILDEAAAALGVDPDLAGSTVTGSGFLRSPYPVSDLATASVAAVAVAVADLRRELGLDPAAAVVDRALADTWFGSPAVPVGWDPPPAWDPLSGAFRTADGWIRLHANAPRHRAALLRALGLGAPDASALAEAVARRGAVELETAILAAGGAAAALRTPSEWAASDAGRAVAAEPLAARVDGGLGDVGPGWRPVPARPLAGLRVLDLTRVLAGPTATQVLAGLGADVLRIDPPDWDEPAVLPLVMWGKRTARLDARDDADGARLRELVAGADVLVHGYRAGALDGLGLGEDARASLRPGLVDVSERAYGFTGPWTGRRGFDSLVQFATGLAHPLVHGTDEPRSLPVQALDLATGHLAAAAAIAGIARRMRTGVGSTWRLSLARTARVLQSAPRGEGRPVDAAPVARTRRTTPLGAVDLADPPFSVGETTPEWAGLGAPLGRDVAEWPAPTEH